MTTWVNTSDIEHDNFGNGNVMNLVDVLDLEFVELTVKLHWWLFLLCIIVFVVQFLTDRDVLS